MPKEVAKIAVFKGEKVRRVFKDNQWWFSIINVIEILTETDRPRKYWGDLKKKLISEGYIEVSEKIGQLKLKAVDGKMRLTDPELHYGRGWGLSLVR